MPGLSPITAPSLQELVYQRLRGAIEAGELQNLEGSNGVGLRELARLLGVSTTPVREAVRRLEAEGLVALDRGTGVTVRRHSAHDLQELAELRLRLETLAIARAVEIATEAEIEELAALVAALDTVADPVEWRDANRELHMALYAPADYPRVKATIRTIWVALEPFLRLYSRTSANLRAAQSEHHALVAAFRARDPEAAVALLTAHIQRSRAALLENPAVAADRSAST